MNPTKSEFIIALEKYNRASKQLFELLNKVPENGPFAFGRDECPLRKGFDDDDVSEYNHYRNSADMFGGGCWCWTCMFCGKEDES